MASINSDGRFLFANGVSDEFEVRLADFASSDISGNDEQFNIITSTTSSIDTWHSHGKIKSEPLKFQITVIKQYGGYFDNNEERIIKKWLVKDERHWFQVDQDDMSDILYYCYMIFNKKENVARGTAGLVFDVICDCGHAWSGLRKKYYTTSNNTLDFTFNSLVDFDNYIIYPTLIITSLGNGNISIKNNTTNELISFTGCSTNEIIILECSTDKCKTSFGNSIVSRWNKQTVGIVENINQFTLTGSFKVEFQYRLPIRVGA